MIKINHDRYTESQSWFDTKELTEITYRQTKTIGLYRENAIAIESEARDPFGGNVYYVTMQITFFIPEFATDLYNITG